MFLKVPQVSAFLNVHLCSEHIRRCSVTSHRQTRTWGRPIKISFFVFSESPPQVYISRRAPVYRPQTLQSLDGARHESFMRSVPAK